MNYVENNTMSGDGDLMISDDFWPNINPSNLVLAESLVLCLLCLLVPLLHGFFRSTQETIAKLTRGIRCPSRHQPGIFSRILNKNTKKYMYPIKLKP